MKKFLSALAAIGITATGASSVVACGTSTDDKISAATSEQDKQIEVLRTQLKETTVNLATTSKSLSDAIQSLKELTENSNKGDAQLNGDIDNVKKQIDGLGKLLIAVQKHSEAGDKELDDSINELGEQVETLEASLNKLAEEQKATNATVKSQIDGLLTDVKAIKGIVNDSTKGNDALLGAIIDLQSKKDAMEGRLTTLESIVKDPTKGNEALLQKINDLENVVKALQNQVNSLQGRIEELEKGKVDKSAIDFGQAEMPVVIDKYKSKDVTILSEIVKGFKEIKDEHVNVTLGTDKKTFTISLKEGQDDFSGLVTVTIKSDNYIDTKLEINVVQPGVKIVDTKGTIKDGLAKIIMNNPETWTIKDLPKGATYDMIKVEPNNKEVVTIGKVDKDGSFIVTGVKSGTTDIIVSGPGFKKTTINLTVEDMTFSFKKVNADGSLVAIGDSVTMYEPQTWIIDNLPSGVSLDDVTITPSKENGDATITKKAGKLEVKGVRKGSSEFAISAKGFNVASITLATDNAKVKIMNGGDEVKNTIELRVGEPAVTLDAIVSKEVENDIAEISSKIGDYLNSTYLAAQGTKGPQLILTPLKASEGKELSFAIKGLTGYDDKIVKIIILPAYVTPTLVEGKTDVTIGSNLDLTTSIKDADKLVGLNLAIKGIAPTGVTLENNKLIVSEDAQVGKVTISATGRDIKGSFDFDVKINKHVINFDQTKAKVEVGQSLNLSELITNANQLGTISYSSTIEAKDGVLSKDGILTIKRDSTLSSVKVTIAGTKAISKEFAITITPRAFVTPNIDLTKAVVNEGASLNLATLIKNASELGTYKFAINDNNKVKGVSIDAQNNLVIAKGEALDTTKDEVIVTLSGADIQDPVEIHVAIKKEILIDQAKATVEVGKNLDLTTIITNTNVLGDVTFEGTINSENGTLDKGVLSILEGSKLTEISVTIKGSKAINKTVTITIIPKTGA